MPAQSTACPNELAHWRIGESKHIHDSRWKNGAGPVIGSGWRGSMFDTDHGTFPTALTDSLPLCARLARKSEKNNACRERSRNLTNRKPVSLQECLAGFADWERSKSRLLQSALEVTTSLTPFKQPRGKSRVGVTAGGWEHAGGVAARRLERRRPPSERRQTCAVSSPSRPCQRRRAARV